MPTVAAAPTRRSAAVAAASTTAAAASSVPSTDSPRCQAWRCGSPSRAASASAACALPHRRRTRHLQRGRPVERVAELDAAAPPDDQTRLLGRVEVGHVEVETRSADGASRAAAEPAAATTVNALRVPVRQRADEARRTSGAPPPAAAG